MKTYKIIFLVAAHVLLGQLATRFPIVSTLHAGAVLAVGIFWVMRGNTVNLVYTVAYIVGGEVFWRMTGAKIFWEYGKYSCAFLMIIFLAMRGWKNPLMPLTYFFCLLPSTVFIPAILRAADSAVHKQISGNLSGPFLLMLSVLFFSKVRLMPFQIKRMFYYMILPIVSILSIAGYMVYTAEDLYFTEASNMATSGGFGPNQVSSVLGLGALTAYLLFFIANPSYLQRIILFVIAIMFATQSALTFSRSGVYTAVLASVAATFYLVNKRKNLIRILITIIFLFAVAHFFVWPRLVKFTGGAIEKRFKETSMTNRESLFSQDLRMFAENLPLGVGPGQSGKYRSAELSGAAGHTEFSRMLAEHGLFGLLSVILLFIMGFTLFRRAKTLIGKAVTVSSLTWAFFFMAINAMRIAAPSLLFGLAAATILPELVVNRHSKTLPENDSSAPARKTEGGKA